MKRCKIALLVFLILLFVGCVSKEEKLIDAVAKGDLTIAKELIEDGAAINIQTKDGISLIDLADKSENNELKEYLKEIRCSILEKETDEILLNECLSDMENLSLINKERKRLYKEYFDLSENLLSQVTSDTRLNDKASLKIEENFKKHQLKFRTFINSKADLIDKIMEQFVTDNYIKEISNVKIRKIINVKILTNLKIN